MAVAIGAALVTAARAIVAGARPKASAIGVSLLAFGLVAIVSALLAPEAGRVAMLGAARLVGSCLLTFAFAASARDLATSTRSPFAKIDIPHWRALTLASAAVLALSLIEQLGGDGMIDAVGAKVDEALLHSFRPKASVTTEGARRLTASFGHANLAASWLAMATPLLVGAALVRRQWQWAQASLALLLVALATTLSRAGLAGGVAATAILIAFLGFVAPKRSVDFVRGRPRHLPLKLAAAATLALALLVARSPTFAARLGLQPLPLISATYTLTSVRLAHGGTRLVLEARNRGSLCWRPWGRDRHVFELRLPSDVVSTAPGSDATDGRRRALEHRVCAGETATAIWEFPVSRAALVGAQAEIVHHGLRRFSELGVPAARLEATSAPGPVAANVSAGTPALVAPARDGGTRAEVGLDHDNADALVPLGRPTLWRAALALWQQRPLLGHGPDTFRVRKASVMERQHVDEREHANNVALELLADIGLAGLLAWLALVWASAAASLRAWRHVDLTAIAASAACVAFMVQGLADSPLFSWGPMVLLALAIGTLAARDSRS